MLTLLRGNRDFRRLFTAQVVSYCGDWFATVAMIGLVLDLTGSALAASLVFVAQSLPAFLMTPFAGPVADRFDRKKVMVVVSAMQVGAALLFLLARSPGTVWLAFAAQMLITALGAFFGPASQAAVPNLVDPEDLVPATTLISATWGAMLAIGSALGAIFATVFGRDAAFMADAASFVLAGLIITSIRRPTSAAVTHVRSRMRPFADTREALAYARRDHSMLYLLLSKGGFGLASGTVGMLAILATDSFGAGDGGTGLLLAARGIGVVAGPVLAGRLARTTDVPGILRVCALSCISYGITYALVGQAPALIVAFALVLIAHLGGGAQWTLSTIGLQLTTPDDMRGRIMAADFALATLSMAISYSLAGVLESVIGVSGVLALFGAFGVLWGLFYLRLTRSLRTELAARPSPNSPARAD